MGDLQLQEVRPAWRGRLLVREPRAGLALAPGAVPARVLRARRPGDRLRLQHRRRPRLGPPGREVPGAHPPGLRRHGGVPRPRRGTRPSGGGLAPVLRKPPIGLLLRHPDPGRGAGHRDDDGRGAAARGEPLTEGLHQRRGRAQYGHGDPGDLPHARVDVHTPGRQLCLPLDRGPRRGPQPSGRVGDAADAGPRLHECGIRADLVAAGASPPSLSFSRWQSLVILPLPFSLLLRPTPPFRAPTC
mmetsp:Transcript_7073/g.18810  ORF Transcript_7073/g.18810 Transcript_7073/m.18810 type:complete len:244 (-) Transcript_7073:297-1028(-)